MHSPSQLKQDFLKKWAKCLQICRSSKKEMSIFERQKAIKVSADIAMASSRNASTCWSLALISNAAKDDNNKVLVEHIVGPNNERLKKASNQLAMCNKFKRDKSKKILKKSRRSVCKARKMAPPMTAARSIAKKLVKKRTQVLKRLVPGGESMDGFSLIKETLDYIVSLRVQVDAMRCLVDATELLNRNKVVHN